MNVIKTHAPVTDGAAEAQRREKSCPKSYNKPASDPGSEPGSLPPSLAPPRSSVGMLVGLPECASSVGLQVQSRSFSEAVERAGCDRVASLGWHVM